MGNHWSRELDILYKLRLIIRKRWFTAVAHDFSIAVGQVFYGCKVIETNFKIDIIIVVLGGVMCLVLDWKEFGGEVVFCYIVLELDGLLLPHAIHFCSLPTFHHQLLHRMPCIRPSQHRLHILQGLLRSQPQNNLTSRLHKLLQQLL